MQLTNPPHSQLSAYSTLFDLNKTEFHWSCSMCGSSTDCPIDKDLKRMKVKISQIMTINQRSVQLNDLMSKGEIWRVHFYFVEVERSHRSIGPRFFVTPIIDCVLQGEWKRRRRRAWRTIRLICLRHRTLSNDRHLRSLVITDINLFIKQMIEDSILFIGKKITDHNESLDKQTVLQGAPRMI